MVSAHEKILDNKSENARNLAAKKHTRLKRSCEVDSDSQTHQNKKQEPDSDSIRTDQALPDQIGEHARDTLLPPSDSTGRNCDVANSIRVPDHNETVRDVEVMLERLFRGG